MGAGAIGSVVGGLLSEVGHDVTLIDQWPAHVDAIKASGLRLGGTCGDRVVRPCALHLHEAQSIQQPFEAVFLSVKGYDTEWATHFAMRFLRPPDGYLVVFQNGLNDERVARLVGRERTLGCVITIRAGLYEPGAALRTDQAPIGFTVGELDGTDTPRLRQLVEALNAVIPSRMTHNLAGERWSKLAVNCLANPLAGLSGYSTADVLIEPVPRAIAIRVASEVIKVARAAGHEVEPIFSIEPQRYVDAAEGRGLEQLEADLIAHGEGRPGGRPSLLQDVLKGRRTEIDDLNGAVVAEGQRLGVPTPINAAVVVEIQRHGAGRLTPDPGNLDALARLVANQPRRPRPVVTRSRLVLEVAEELASDNSWPWQQARVHLRPQGGGDGSVTLFGSDSPDSIEQVARGEVDFAIVNPASPLTLALRGTGPFREPLPLRAVAVIPSEDAFAFAVAERTGLRTLEDIRDRRYPLRVSLRGQRDHGNHFLEREALGALGFSLDDLVAWGGHVRYDPGLPTGIATSGSNLGTSRLDLVARGEIDAIFDEAIGSWLERGLAIGLRVLSLDPALVEKLEGLGFHRAVLRPAQFRGLDREVLTLDFSGWPIFTRADVADDVVTAFCAALDARKERIPWEGEGPLPVERMCRNTPDAPLTVPLHPAAEAYWRQRGYL